MYLLKTGGIVSNKFGKLNFSKKTLLHLAVILF
ncbi:hypothetical protein HME9304_01652 [Flagellimonas maritima]|uniref:Uncharacterized protein n=1 Tax=Flagellimonas maritima TaxID=1383885 RepID=A0A2Z4LSG1_9FLAO|nr:hypothetical protein HME9304_01652 [Allomuricauda aurantiaca]